MALIKCPECGKEISDKAASCPNCGYPINAATIHTENGNDEIFLDEYKDDEIEDTNSNTSSRLSKFKDIIIGSHIWIPLVCVVIIAFIILILVFSRNRQQKNIQYSNNNNVNTILQSSTHDISTTEDIEQTSTESTTENTEETSTESIQEDIEVEDTQIEKNNVNRENNDNVNENEILQTENPIRNNSNNNVTEKKTERVHVLKAAQSLPLNDLKYYGIGKQILTKASVFRFEYKAQKYSDRKDLYTIRLRIKMTYNAENTATSSILLMYYIYDSNGIQVDSRPISVSGAQLNKEATYEFLTYLEPGVYTIEFADYQ